MIKLIRLVNVYYVEDGHKVKESFKTFLDTIDNKKIYKLESKNEVLEITKEQGNHHYEYLKQDHPEMKAVVVIGIDENNVSYIRVNEHFEVRLGGEFYCACDTVAEACEARGELKKGLQCK